MKRNSWLPAKVAFLSHRAMLASHLIGFNLYWDYYIKKICPWKYCNQWRVWHTSVFRLWRTVFNSSEFGHIDISYRFHFLEHEGIMPISLTLVFMNNLRLVPWIFLTPVFQVRSICNTFRMLFWGMLIPGTGKWSVPHLKFRAEHFIYSIRK